jgi:hypothetical protein
MRDAIRFVGMAAQRNRNWGILKLPIVLQYLILRMENANAGKPSIQFPYLDTSKNKIPLS